MVKAAPEELNTGVPDGVVTAAPDRTITTVENDIGRCRFMRSILRTIS